MPQFKRVRLINPRKSNSRRMKRNASGQFVRRTKRKNPFRARRPRKSAARVSRRPGARPRTKNPLGEELILLSNPHRNKKKKNSHRSSSRARTNPFRARRSRRRSNPFRPRRRSRNPISRDSAKGFVVEGVKFIAAGAAGAIGTRALTQAVLGDKNVGAMGYLSNLVVALGGGALLFKFTKSKAIAYGWATGGAANTVQRIWSEKVSMTSPAAAAPALSDLDYSSNGLGGVGLSGYVSSGFALPSVTGQDGTVQAPFQAQVPAVSAQGGSTPGASVLNIPGGNVARYQPRY